MTKRFTIDDSKLNLIDNNTKIAYTFDNTEDCENCCGLLNKLNDENEQLKKDRFICLDCKHSGYTEIGCLCEYTDHWQEHITECEDFEEWQE